jgi:16S rRNA (cytosine967-C5)-methyltransferase
LDRLERLRENLARTGLPAEIVAADLMEWQPPGPADAVLLDAPCSATGIYRRHPDVLYRVRPRAIAALAEGQAAMLGRAAEWVKRGGGTLVYSVCSLEPEEGEAVAEAFLASRIDYEIAPVGVGELPRGFAPDARGLLRILPGALEAEGGADSFFIARFRRR